VLNLNHVIEEYIRSPEHEKLTTAHEAVAVHVDLDTALLDIEGSATQLTKMIMNLVSNAAEAQPTGGRTVISTANRYVEKEISGFEVIPEGEYVLLEIRDNGLGIANEDLVRIFEPFYTKKVMGRSGTGLGMAVVWGTVHDHRGFIDVQSREGFGSRFRIYFPVTRKEKSRSGKVISVDEYMGGGESILVVDDVPEQREIAQRILSKLNYRVAAVSSGEAAVDYLQQHTADLLVLDMIMDPGIDGLEAYRRIRQHRPDQKAIIASGYSETHRIETAREMGIDEYLKKPYTLEKIGVAVKKALGERRNACG
jgi:CheY-like chemotaxis protein